jgi:plastocyanin
VLLPHQQPLTQDWEFIMVQKFLVAAVLLLGMTLSGAVVVKAEEAVSFTVVIKDHRFTPEEVVVPVDKAFSLVVINQDATPEEFESRVLKREKIVKGNSQITLKMPALKAGEYPFVGEFHEATAKGKIVAR